MQDLRTSSNKYYGEVVAGLFGLFSLLFIPQYTFNEKNWHFLLLIHLILGWVLFMDFLRILLIVIKDKYDSSLMLLGILISLIIFSMLSLGTVSYFKDGELKTISGDCRVSTLINRKIKRFQLRIVSPNDVDDFSISQKEFRQLIHPDQYLVKSERFILYPCQQMKIRAYYVPIFHLLVKTEWEQEN